MVPVTSSRKRAVVVIILRLSEVGCGREGVEEEGFTSPGVMCVCVCGCTCVCGGGGMCVYVCVCHEWRERGGKQQLTRGSARVGAVGWRADDYRHPLYLSFMLMRLFKAKLIDDACLCLRCCLAILFSANCNIALALRGEICLSALNGGVYIGPADSVAMTTIDRP